MYRLTRLAAAVVVLNLLPGCRIGQWLRDHCNWNVGAQNGRLSGTFGCHSSPTGTVVDRLADALNVAEEVVSRGSSAAFDECVAFGLCSGPDDQSDVCDTCRWTAANTVVSPSLVACRGTAYGPAPDTLTGYLEAQTAEFGRLTTPFTVTYSRRSSTPVSFTGCGTETVEYILPEGDRQRVINWIQPYIDQGLHNMPYFALVQTGPSGAEEGGDLLALGSAGATSCQGSSDPVTCGLWLGGYLFGADTTDQPAHGVLTQSAMLPTTPSTPGGGYSFSGPADYTFHP